MSAAARIKHIYGLRSVARPNEFVLVYWHKDLTQGVLVRSPIWTESAENLWDWRDESGPTVSRVKV